MSETNNSNNNLDIVNKPRIFYLSLIEIEKINKLLSYDYKIVDENDKDIQQYIKNKRAQEIKLNKKKLHPFHTKQISSIDKKKLSDNIRGLPEEQLKGILNLIDKKNEAVEKDGFFEIDIDTLSEVRLRELEKYVRSCLKSSGNDIPTRYQDEFKKIKKENNEENEETVKSLSLSENKI